MRLLLLGNAGAGKSTMAHRLLGSADIPRLSLDEIAWNQGPRRKPLEESRTLLRQFIEVNEQWSLRGVMAASSKRRFRTALNSGS